MEFLYSGIGIVLGVGVVSIYVKKVLKVLEEIVDTLSAVQSMLADGQVTKDEIANVVKEAKEVVGAIKDFGKK